MKVLQMKKSARLSLGVKTALGILDVEAASAGLRLEVPLSMRQLIDSGESGLATLRELSDRARGQGLREWFVDEAMASFGPVITNPEKILCVGLNYANHAQESKMELPTSPILFSKFNNALAGHKEAVHLPKAAVKFDYEAELVLVIRKTARNVNKEEALSYVFGYSAGNDLSARDLQFRTGQWLLGKTCDGFAPLGPYLVTTDELEDPGRLEVQCKVNGELRQSGNTREMIFDCPTLISYISQHMTLQPGDVIYTGTPDGVILGYPESDQKWLKPDDTVEVSIERIGTLVNQLVN